MFHREHMDPLLLNFKTPNLTFLIDRGSTIENVNPAAGDHE